MSQSDSHRGERALTKWLTNKKQFPCDRKRKRTTDNYAHWLLYFKKATYGIYEKGRISHVEQFSNWGVCGLWMRTCIWGVCEVLNEQMCAPGLFFGACVRMTARVHTHTHTHKSIMSLWSLQSNSFRQKSLKQPRFWSSCYPPSVSSLLNSHQPLLLPKITQERHSNPRLTHSTAWPQERDQNTHKKGNTSYCGRRGKKRAFVQLHTSRYLLMILATGEPHILTHQAKTRKRKVCLWMCVPMRTIWIKYIVTAKTAFISDLIQSGI